MNPLFKLAAIEAAISEYHHSLNKREHRGVAQDRCIKEIEAILGMPWKRGDTPNDISILGIVDSATVTPLTPKIQS